jgi:hypothetical protein
MKFLPLLAACLLGVRAQGAPSALEDNEQLVYRVSWSIVPAVGRITVTAHAVQGPGGRPQLQVVTETETRGLGYLILPFDAHAESVYDGPTGRLMRFSETSSTRSRNRAHTITFDYSQRRAIYSDPSQPVPVRSLSLPPGNPSDLVDCLLSTRTARLAPGQTQDALVFFEDVFYQLTVHAVRTEDVLTPMGEYRALLLEPRMEKTPPLGMFRHGSIVKVWIAEDPPHLPVRFQVQFNFGTGVATLVSYRPPSPAPAVADRRAGEVQK